MKRICWVYDGNHVRHPFLPLAAETLAKTGQRVTVLDRAPDSGRASYKHLSLASLDPGVGPKQHSWRLFLGAVWSLLRRRPDIVIATLPAAGLAGWTASVLSRARFVYYPFELFGEQGYEPPLWQVRVERAILRRGIDALITQNQERARFYQTERESRVRPTIVHNYKPARQAVAKGRLRELLELPPDERIVLYEGILHTGRCLDRLVAAVRFFPDRTTLVLMGEKKSWWDPNVGPLLRDAEIARRVRVLPAVPHAELLDYVVDADVGVLVYDDTALNSRYCAPGKLSDYVLAGVPVISSNQPTLGPVVRQLGLGVVFSVTSPEAIAEAVREVLAVPRLHWESGLRKAQTDMVWESQIPAFLGAVRG